MTSKNSIILVCLLAAVPNSKKHGTMLRMRMLKAAIENASFRETLKQRKLLLDVIERRKRDADRP